MVCVRSASWYGRIHGAVVGVALVVTAASCKVAGPQVEDWEPLGLDGEWVTAVVETAWGLFAGTRAQGLFRFETTGSWASLGVTESIVSSTLFVEEPKPRLLVGVTPIANETTSAAVFASNDQGATWVPWDGGLAAANDNRFWAYSLAQDPAVPNRLFMGSSYSILRSDDGGASWTFVFGSEDSWGQGIHSISVGPDGTGQVWAGGQSALGVAPIFRSEDHGTTWEVGFPANRSEFAVRSVLGDPSTPGRVWAGLTGSVEGASVIRSDDGGSSWTPSLSAGIPVYDLVVHTGIVYAVGRDFTDTGNDRLAVFRHEGHDTWVQISTPSSARGGLAATVTEVGELIVGTAGSGVWRVRLRG